MHSLLCMTYSFGSSGFQIFFFVDINKLHNKSEKRKDNTQVTSEFQDLQPEVDMEEALEHTLRQLAEPYTIVVVYSLSYDYRLVRGQVGTDPSATSIQRKCREEPSQTLGKKFMWFVQRLDPMKS